MSASKYNQDFKRLILKQFLNFKMLVIWCSFLKIDASDDENKDILNQDND